MIDKIKGLIGKKIELADQNVATNKRQVSNALAELNCDGTWKKEGEEEIVSYSYQDGYFEIRLHPKVYNVLLSFYHFAEIELDYFQNLRSLCNNLNIYSDGPRFIYTNNENKGTVAVHLVNNILLDKDRSKDIISKAMADIFGWRNLFIQRFQELKEVQKRNNEGDMEYKELTVSQKKLMIREHEISHGNVFPNPRENENNGISILKWLETAFQMQGVVPSELTIITDDIKVLKDREVISNFNFSKIIIEDNRFSRNFATLNLTFFLTSEPDRRRYATFTLQRVDQIDRALYYRVTATLMPLNAETKESIFSGNLMPQLSTTIIAYDLRDNDKQVAEFKFMWQDAMDKIAEGKNKELTDEQRFIASITFPNVAQCLYCGRKLFNAHRRYEAVVWLEKGFHYLHPNYFKLDKTDKENFYEICFMLGSCYNDLQLYQRAFYYLNFTIGLQNVIYTAEYVNCLTNSKDFRALSYIDSLLENLYKTYQIDDEDDNSDEIPIHINNFMLFLYRRKAYVLIEREFYKEAKELLMPMLEIPQCSEFAIKELDYLQKITNRQNVEEDKIKKQNK